jgi:hypothetical protein
MFVRTLVLISFCAWIFMVQAQERSPSLASDNAAAFQDRISSSAATETTVSGVVMGSQPIKREKTLSERIHSLVGGMVQKKKGEGGVVGKNEENLQASLKKAVKIEARKMSTYAENKKSAVKLRTDLKSMKKTTKPKNNIDDTAQQGQTTTTTTAAQGDQPASKTS